jgi:hypothetical protein
MERRGDEVHVETTEASGGSREGVVRWVLIIGTLLAIVLLSIIWMTGAAFQGDVEEEGNVGGQIRSMERGEDSTDSIIEAPSAESELPGETAETPAPDRSPDAAPPAT